MTTIYDTASRQSYRRRAVDSAELLIRSRKWQGRAVAFILGFLVTTLMMWITRGVQ